ncbi:hypothetical protein EAH_00064310 [Eimeria acervulina]|uniref:Uncharacterized protein n=1 Tax=Eimeria acervulina TaxID=5801 RepID=U6GR48_EIMAC|nr:hypothetical protein EAH_00064310 [Eimeria acervulina]CDI82022.1 hypothetical protein EAH_00064310 [Eimeria acervulina]
MCLAFCQPWEAMNVRKQMLVQYRFSGFTNVAGRACSLLAKALRTRLQGAPLALEGAYAVCATSFVAMAGSGSVLRYRRQAVLRRKQLSKGALLCFTPGSLELRHVRHVRWLARHWHARRPGIEGS